MAVKQITTVSLSGDYKINIDCEDFWKIQNKITLVDEDNKLEVCRFVALENGVWLLIPERLVARPLTITPTKTPEAQPEVEAEKPKVKRVRKTRSSKKAVAKKEK